MKRNREAVALCCLVVVLTGCASSTTTANRPDVDVVPGVAQLHPDDESVTMPLSAFELSPRGYTTLARAADLLTQGCMKAAGYSVQYPDRMNFPDRDIGGFSFGVWTTKRAAEYGYGFAPRPDAEVAFNQYLNSQSPEFLDALHGCFDDPEVDALTDAKQKDGVAVRGEDTSWRLMESDQRAKVIFDAHRECMAAKGYQVGDDWVVSGIDAMNAEHQTATALADVDCKDKSRWVQGLADIGAAYEQVYITDHRPELKAEKAELDALLVRADEIISQAGTG